MQLSDPTTVSGEMSVFVPVDGSGRTSDVLAVPMKLTAVDHTPSGSVPDIATPNVCCSAAVVTTAVFERLSPCLPTAGMTTADGLCELMFPCGPETVIGWPKRSSGVWLRTTFAVVGVCAERPPVPPEHAEMPTQSNAPATKQ